MEAHNAYRRLGILTGQGAGHFSHNDYKGDHMQMKS